MKKQRKRKIEIKTDGYTRNTLIFIDGVEQKNIQGFVIEGSIYSPFIKLRLETVSDFILFQGSLNEYTRTDKKRA